MENKNMSLETIVTGINAVDDQWLTKARQRTAQLVMPTRALGRLHDVSEQLCAIRSSLQPPLSRKAVLVMAADHGVVAEGVSAYPQEVTGAMVQTFLAGGATINAIARHVNAEVWVVDMGIIPQLDPGDLPCRKHLLVHKIAAGTANFTRGPAMAADQARQAILTGFQLAADLFDQGLDILGTGDMGIGNTTPSSAIAVTFTGITPAEATGRGTGIDDDGLQRKIAVIERALAANRPDPADPLGVLAKVGGFEIGGIAGLILGAAAHRIPVIVDGFISTAGALIAGGLSPAAKNYMFSGHNSVEVGHRAMLAHLGLTPLLDLRFRLGEGTGAVLAAFLVESAVRALNDMATFAEAAVSEKNE